MMQTSKDFLEGFIAAARTFGLDLTASPPERFPARCRPSAGGPELCPGTHLTLDDYLAIPTFLRQGQGLAVFMAAGFAEK